MMNQEPGEYRQMGAMRIRLRKRPETSATPRAVVTPTPPPEPKPKPQLTKRRKPTQSTTPVSKTCVNRGDQVGKINCGCQGAKLVYLCKVHIRPNTTPPAAAFCVPASLSKYIGIKLANGERLTRDQVPKDEILVCDKRYCDSCSLSFK